MKTCNHTEQPGHDCAYVDARNAWIPLATDWANLIQPVDDDEWDEAFLNAMQFLTRYGVDGMPGLAPPNLRALLLPGRERAA